MHILLLTPYISVPGDKRFTRKNTEFGRCVFDIARQIALRGGDVSLLLNQFNPGGLLEGVEVIGCNTQAAAQYARGGFTQSILQMALNSGLKKHRIFDIYLSLLCEGYMEKTIHRLAPDVVHVHGLTLTTFALLAAAVSSSFPTVLTLHQLNSASPSPSSFETLFEQSAIETLNELGFTLSVVSAGIKSYILRHFRILHEDKLFVIPPGINNPCLGSVSTKAILRNTYNIQPSRLVLVDLSPPHACKQRYALLEGLLRLDPAFRKNILLLIPGEGLERQRLSAFIRLKGLQDNICLVNPADPGQTADFLALADLTIYYGDHLDSGFSIIRSWGAGLPVLSTADQETVKSLYHPQCMEMIFEAAPQFFAEGIERAISRPWHTEAICNQAAAFFWDRVTPQYQQLYGYARPVSFKPEDLLARIFMKMQLSKLSQKNDMKTPLCQ